MVLFYFILSIKLYLDFVDDALVELQALRLEADRTKKTFQVLPVS
jgi:hypothetical protein